MTSLSAEGRQVQRLAALPSRSDERRAMARWLAMMWGAASVMGLAAPLVPNYGLAIPEIDVVIGIVAAPISVLCLVLGARMTPRLAQVLLGLGLVAVTAAIHAVGPGPHVYGGAIYTMWIPIYAAMFFSRRAALCWLVASAAVLGASLAWFRKAEMVGVWLDVVVAVAIVSLVVARLASRNRAMAFQDALTGLPNRRLFEEVLAMLTASAARHAHPLTLVSIDLDGLKQVNDQRGHAAGDQHLARAADAWSRVTRRSDLLARLGGDEFALLLPDTDDAAARHLVDRMRAATPDVPFSAGVVTWDRETDIDDLLAEGDRRLYADKASRR